VAVKPESELGKFVPKIWTKMPKVATGAALVGEMLETVGALRPPVPPPPTLPLAK